MLGEPGGHAGPGGAGVAGAQQVGPVRAGHGGEPGRRRDEVEAGLGEQRAGEPRDPGRPAVLGGVEPYATGDLPAGGAGADPTSALNFTASRWAARIAAVPSSFLSWNFPL